MATDTPVNTLIINKMTEAQYKSATKSPTELYVTTDSPKPLTTVAHDDTVVGTGTSSDPLKVAAPIPSGGTTGQVLTKTDAGTEWKDATGGGTGGLPDGWSYSSDGQNLVLSKESGTGFVFGNDYSLSTLTKSNNGTYAHPWDMVYTSALKLPPLGGTGLVPDEYYIKIIPDTVYGSDVLNIDNARLMVSGILPNGSDRVIGENKSDLNPDGFIFGMVFTKKINSGDGDLVVPAKAGTLATTDDCPTVTDNPDNGTKIIRIGKTVIITGRATEASVGAGVATHTAPITLPVTMANNTYTVLLTPTCGGGLAQLNVDYEDETTTGFTIGLRNVGSTTSSDININWVVIGDIAE